MPEKKAIIIGAGPAGLTAAYQLLCHTDIKPVIFEASNKIGGISRTVNYKGNRIDLGGHRFFSKSKKVLNWWLNIFPLEGEKGVFPGNKDQLMLKRKRISRIFYNRKFFNYPLQFDTSSLSNLGIRKIIKIAADYTKVKVRPFKKENSLEDFFINRFGEELYNTFFKSYTGKVWGISPAEIGPQWGIQRIKGMSVSKAILHATKRLFTKNNSIYQHDTETSLIERFMYPKYGPGQFWEKVAEVIQSKGALVYKNKKIVGISSSGNKVDSVDVLDCALEESRPVKGDYFFSTMPVRDLIKSWRSGVPQEVKEVAGQLLYRDFLTVGILVKKLKVGGYSRMGKSSGIIPDNWVYIQEKDVRLGRVQVFNNWSPYMVKDSKNTVWLGLEYFCNEGDCLWSRPNQEIIDFAKEELIRIGFVNKDDILDAMVVRNLKAYPVYSGQYCNFYKIRKFIDQFSNLFLIGRNGMHRYNNTDHSMLTAMEAVENIVNEATGKENIWNVNA